MELTQELLKSKLSYNETTGEFTWRPGTHRAFFEAGHVDNTGYRRIHIAGRLWQAHVLAWLYVHGQLPSASIDHINRVRTDNRIANLRVALPGTQSYNTCLRSDSTSKIKGVSFCNFTKRWKAHFSAGGKTKTLGRYDTKEEARIARECYEKAWLEAQNGRGTLA